MLAITNPILWSKGVRTTEIHVKLTVQICNKCARQRKLVNRLGGEGARKVNVCVYKFSVGMYCTEHVLRLSSKSIGISEENEESTKNSHLK
jgi:hypothetical protein